MRSKGSSYWRSQRARRARSQRTGLIGLTGAAALALAPALAALAHVARQGAPALDAGFLLSPPRGGFAGGGIGPAVAGTLALVAVTLAVAVPLGVGAAIYLREYAAGAPAARWVRLTVLNLAGIPSVVYGLFGLALFGIALGLGPSLLTGGLTLGLLVLPVVIAAADEALAAVPRSLREASLALGAGQWQTIRHAVLPRALPGIITGGMLAVARAAGETAPVLFTAAALYLPHGPHSLLDRVMTLPTHLYAITTQVPGVPAERQYGTALVLLILVLGLQALAMLLRRALGRT